MYQYDAVVEFQVVNVSSFLADWLVIREIRWMRMREKVNKKILCTCTAYGHTSNLHLLIDWSFLHFLVAECHVAAFPIQEEQNSPFPHEFSKIWIWMMPRANAPIIQCTVQYYVQCTCSCHLRTVDYSYTIDYRHRCWLLTADCWHGTSKVLVSIRVLWQWKWTCFLRRRIQIIRDRTCTDSDADEEQHSKHSKHSRHQPQTSMQWTCTWTCTCRQRSKLLNHQSKSARQSIWVAATANHEWWKPTKP